jgi:hypothetical protein
MYFSSPPHGNPYWPCHRGVYLDMLELYVVQQLENCEYSFQHDGAPPHRNNNVWPFPDETMGLVVVEQTPFPTPTELHYRLDITRATRGCNAEVTYITNKLFESRNNLQKTTYLGQYPFFWLSSSNILK